MKKSFLSLLFCGVAICCVPKISFSQSSLIDLQGSAMKLSGTFSRAEDTLKRQFESKKLAFPPKEMYIRSFKYDRELEVWVRYNDNEPFKLFKTYKVCMQSGTMGPKRMEGDYQVPEGFYYINEFNPNSNYHLACRFCFRASCLSRSASWFSPSRVLALHRSRSGPLSTEKRSPRCRQRSDRESASKRRIHA